MERAGLVHRERSDTDGRALTVMLSSEGRSLIPQVRKIWAEVESATIGGLSSKQLAALIESLKLMKEDLSNALDGNPRRDR